MIPAHKFSLGFASILLTGSVLAQDQVFEFQGERRKDHFGFAAAGAGDVNRDGIPDLVVGAFRNDHGGPHAHWDSGQVCVYSGVDGSLLYEWFGMEELDQFGFAVDGAGDLNADGYADVIVGARYDDNNGDASGSATVFSGIDGSLLYQFNGDSPGDWLGFDVAGVGDVNQDGFDDVIAGAPREQTNGTRSGMARVYSGRDGSILFEVMGSQSHQHLGKAVAGAGDADGDGHPDFAVGAPTATPPGGEPEAGCVQVFSGKTGQLLWMKPGDETESDYGRAIHTAGDLTGDGKDELIVGAYLYDRWDWKDAGLVHVLDGVDGSEIFSFNGDSRGDWAGWSVSGGGDFDGDQVPDLLVGIVYDDNNGEWSGSARVYSGADHSILWTWNGKKALDYFGAAVDFVGDCDQDGLDDVIVGAYRTDDRGKESGSAFVFRGGTRPLIGLKNPLAGVKNTFFTVNGTRRATVSYFGSFTGFGAWDVNGIYLDLRQPVFMGKAFADGSGASQLRVKLPGKLSGVMVFFQAIESLGAQARATTANCAIVQ